ncbi:MAG: hypothetical protein ABR498_06795, partial [Candidatus Dormibacteria bacterium]
TPDAVVYSFSPGSPLPATAATPAPPNGAATPPSIAAGVVKVTVTDGHNSISSTDDKVLAQEPPITNLDNATPTEGALETISAQPSAGGLSQFEPSTGIPGAGMYFNFAGCAGQTITSGYGFAPDTNKQPADLTVLTNAPYATCNGDAVAHFFIAPDAGQTADCTATTPSNCIAFDKPIGHIVTKLAVAVITPNPVGPGGVIAVVGTGFGTDGSARLDDTQLTPVIPWSDHYLLEFRVPKDLGPHTLFLHRTQQGADGEFDAGTVTIKIGAPLGPVGLPFGLLFPGGPLSFVPGHLGVPPGAHNATTGNQLKLTLASTKADAGSDVKYTVAIVVNGKPQANTPVTLTVVSSPGADTKIRPASGKTDATGKLTGVVHLSSQLGTTIVLARSGTYSDEASVLSQKPKNQSVLPFIDLSGNPLVVWLSLATVALIALGVIVNLNVLRRFLWAMTFGRLIRRLRAKPTPIA